MKKFRCEVTLTSEYEIEIKDEDFEDGFIEEFKRHFYDFDNWSEHAAHIAVRKALGDDFIEGYGVPLVNGERPVFRDERDLEKAINIKVEYENEVDVDCVEICQRT